MSGRNGALPVSPDQVLTSRERGELEHLADVLAKVARVYGEPAHVITKREAARRLGLLDKGVEDPDRIIGNMVRASKLRAVRVGREDMIDPRSIAAFIDAGGG